MVDTACYQFEPLATVSIDSVFGISSVLFVLHRMRSFHSFPFQMSMSRCFPLCKSNGPTTTIHHLSNHQTFEKRRNFSQPMNLSSVTIILAAKKFKDRIRLRCREEVYGKVPLCLITCTGFIGRIRLFLPEHPVVQLALAHCSVPRRVKRDEKSIPAKSSVRF